MNKWAGYLILGISICGTLAGASDAGSQGTKAGVRLTLAEAVRMSISHAPQVLLADAQTRRAIEALREVRASNFPQIVAGTGLAYNNGFPLSIEGSAPSAFQVGLSQPVFSKKNKNLILEAREEIKATEVMSESTRNELSAATALTYFDLYHARRLEGLWAARLESANEDEKTTETLLEGGRIKPLDVTQARSAVSVAQYQLMVAQEQARLAQAELCLLTGLPKESVIQTEEPQLDPQVIIASGDSLYQKALESHPDIRQAEINVKGKEYHVEAEKGGWYPRIDFVTEYSLFTRFNNYQDYFNTFTRNNYLVGMSIQVPVFDGFLARSRVAQSRQEVSEAQLRLERLKLELKLSIERICSALKIARGAADLARSEQAAALEVVKVSETLLEGGRLSAAEVAKARSQAQEKEVAILEADKIAFQRQLELMKLTGGLAPLF